MARGLPSNKFILIHFSKAKSPLAFFSKLTMLVEKRPYSHVAVELVDPATQTPLVFQASKNIVNFFYKKTFLEHNKVIESYMVEVTPLEYIAIWRYALLKMGSDYGWMEILSILTKKLFNIKSWFKNGDRTNICSELAARVCRIAGLPMPESLDDMTPSDLNKILEKAEKKGIIKKWKE